MYGNFIYTQQSLTVHIKYVTHKPEVYYVCGIN
jgi:hypothetical protein